MAYDKSLIQVLWVEDNKAIHATFAAQAEKYDIQLVPVECWQDAEKLLEEDYNRWQAIILDAKCKYKINSEDNAQEFLACALDSISEFKGRKGHFIPWYILSGQAEEDIRRSIPPSRLKWDGDWDDTVNRPYYDKNKEQPWGGNDENGKQKTLPEYKILFLRIKAHLLSSNTALALRLDYYPEVFKALDDLALSGEVEKFMIDLLGPIHFKGTKDDDYNHRYSDVRKLLEHIFRDIIERNILPSAYHTDGKKDEINISWSSEYLGKDKIEHCDRRKKNEVVVIRHINRLLPIQLADMLKTTVFQCGGAVHTSKADATIQLNLDNYLPHVNRSPYMLRSISLAMADFIVWYRNYIRNHEDPELNKLDWDVIIKEK